jgi:hypothetical protein
VTNSQPSETITITLPAADVVKLRAIARADALSLEEWARDALLAYAAAEWEDDEFRADFGRLLDAHPDVLDELAGRDERPETDGDLRNRRG